MTKASGVGEGRITRGMRELLVGGNVLCLDCGCGYRNMLEKEMATRSGIFLPEEFHGQRSLEGCRRGRKESDTTERLTL